jgi:hypothetical protein
MAEGKHKMQSPAQCDLTGRVAGAPLLVSDPTVVLHGSPHSTTAIPLTNPDQPLEGHGLPCEPIAQLPDQRDLSDESREVRRCLDAVERSIDTVNARYVEMFALFAGKVSL